VLIDPGIRGKGDLPAFAADPLLKTSKVQKWLPSIIEPAQMQLRLLSPGNALEMVKGTVKLKGLSPDRGREQGHHKEKEGRQNSHGSVRQGQP
jgi:hypothetical protein